MTFASNVRSAILSTLLRSKSSKMGFAIIVAFLGVIFLGPSLVPYGPNFTSSAINSPPSIAHLLGTDFQGHDVLSQVLWGAYPSMTVAVLAGIGAILLGVFVGVIAGYYTRLEGLLTGTTDAILTFPPLPLMVLLGTLYPATNLMIIAILT